MPVSFVRCHCEHIMLEKLCLQWNDFKENVNSAFASLREDNDFSDVTLVSEDGQQVEAHRVILAASKSIFRETPQEKQTLAPTDFHEGFAV